MKDNIYKFHQQNLKVVIAAIMFQSEWKTLYSMPLQRICMSLLHITNLQWDFATMLVWHTILFHAKGKTMCVTWKV